MPRKKQEIPSPPTFLVYNWFYSKPTEPLIEWSKNEQNKQFVYELLSFAANDSPGDAARQYTPEMQAVARLARREFADQIFGLLLMLGSPKLDLDKLNESESVYEDPTDGALMRRGIKIDE